MTSVARTKLGIDSSTTLIIRVAWSSDEPRIVAETLAVRALEERFAETALSAAARQVQRCYRSPRVASEGRQIVTRLRVRLTADGEVAGLPVVVLQDGVTPANEPFAGRMAEAAIAAVIRCAPLHFPQPYYRDGFTEFDLTFSPVARG